MSMYGERERERERETEMYVYVCIYIPQTSLPSGVLSVLYRIAFADRDFTEGFPHRPPQPRYLAQMSIACRSGSPHRQPQPRYLSLGTQPSCQQPVDRNFPIVSLSLGA